MKRSRFKQEQIIAILAEVRSGRTPKEVCAEHNISQQTFGSPSDVHDGIMSNF